MKSPNNIEKMRIRKFKINEYLTFKLEDDKTIIYVAEGPFKQCKYWLFSFLFQISKK